MESKTILQQTKTLCRQLGIVPTKSKGQNFLVSEKVLEQIVSAADLQPEDLVLEIGPGLGILTGELVKKAKRVVAVELDKKLFGYLSEKFEGVKNLELVEGDIIKLLNGQIVKLLGKGEYKVVANLPYQITSHILRLLLESEHTTPARELATPPQRGGERAVPREMILMVQKEVGERICAKPGDMSILSVMVQYYSQPEIVAVVGRDNFWPVPEVDSAVVKILTPRPSLLVKGEGKREIEDDLFFKLVKIGFSGKRKMLKNNLRNVYNEEEVLADLVELGLNPKVRAEDLGVEEWLELYKKLKIKDKK